MSTKNKFKRYKTVFKKIAELFGGGITSITAAELKAKLDNKESFQIIDVRTRQEYKSDGHIAKIKVNPIVRTT